MSSTQVSRLPALTALPTRRASESAYEVLRREILSGELAPGTRLLEAVYARQLGISQGTLREALAKLVHDGLAISLPRRGTYVAALPVDTIYQLYELRERVEPLALRLAMDNLRPSDIEHLETLVPRMSARNMHERIDADMQFHGLLYEASGFPPLQGLWPQIEILTRKFLALSHPIAPAAALRGYHRAILDAVIANDVQQLDVAVAAHMKGTTALVTREKGT